MSCGSLKNEKPVLLTLHGYAIGEGRERERLATYAIGEGRERESETVGYTGGVGAGMRAARRQ